jgi:aspartyl-tRNA(Asn)/glutamyl-tRNA(Gln) amidotransferase subunit B
LADYFEAVTKGTRATPKVAANWVMGELTGALNRAGLEIEATRVPAAALAALLDKIEAGTISGKIAKEVFEAMWNGEGSVDAIIEKRGLVQISDAASIDKLVAEILAANPAQVEQFRAGKQQVLGFLVGQVMKASRGKANPQQVNEALRKQLGS